MKFRYIGFFLLFLASLHAQKKVKLALSGGGARGFAHVGVIKALEEYGFEITGISGTSAGALIGSLYASGYSTDSIHRIIREFTSVSSIFSDYSRKDIPIERKFETYSNFVDLGITNEGPVLPSALSGDSRLNFFLLKYLAEANLAARKQFKNLPIPLTIVASDVFEEKGIEFTSGDLPRAVRASISIPTALPPIEMDGRLFVDGGLYNNLPTNVFDSTDFVIAVNAASVTYKDKNELKSFVDIAGHMINILSSKSDSNSVKKWDIFIEPDLNGFTATSWFNADSLIQLGYKQAIEVLKSKGYTRQNFIRKTTPKPLKFENFKVGSVNLTGSYRLTKEHIMRNLGIELDSYFSWEQMRSGINRLYAQNLIKDFWVSFSIINNKLNLNFEIEENILTRIGLGGFNQTEMGNNIHVGLKFIGRLGFAETIATNLLVGDYRSGLRLGVRYNSILDIPMFDYFNYSFYQYKPQRYDSLEARYSNHEIKYSSGLYINREMMLLGTIGYEQTVQKIGSNRDVDLNEEEIYNRFYIRAEYVLENLDDLYFPTTGSSINIGYTFNQVEYKEAKGAAIPLGFDGDFTFYNQFNASFSNHSSTLSGSTIFSQSYNFATTINQKTSTIPLLHRHRLDLTHSTQGIFDPTLYKFHFFKTEYALKREIYDNVFLHGSFSVAKEWKQLEKISFEGFEWDNLSKGFEFGVYIPTFLGPISLTYSRDDFFQNAIRLSTGFIR